MKASLIPSVLPCDGGMPRTSFSCKESGAEQVKMYCLDFTHPSSSSHSVFYTVGHKQAKCYYPRSSKLEHSYGSDSLLSFSFVVCPFFGRDSVAWMGSGQTSSNCKRMHTNTWTRRCQLTFSKGHTHHSFLLHKRCLRLTVRCGLPPSLPQSRDFGVREKIALPCQHSAVPHYLCSHSFDAFLVKELKQRNVLVRRRGYRLVARALKKRAQLVIPDAVKVEPGKYSYDVETVINQLSCLAPRASITRFMDSYRNKLSMKDFSLIFREFGQRGDWERALRLFRYMHRQQWCKPHEHIYTIVIGILGREGLLDRCSEIFEEMPNQGVDWDVYSFTAMINAYGRNGQYEASLHLLSRMKRERVTPNLITYNTVINACAKGGMDWEGLLGLFAQMRHEGIQPDIITYNTLLGACSLRGLHEEATMVFRTMNEAGVVPDQGTYSLLVETFGNMQRLDSVSELLREMEVSGNVPDTIAYNVLLEAFAKDGNVAKAAGVFKQMLQAACSPNVNTYSTLLDCYGKLGRFDDVRELFTEMKASGIAPDIVTYNTLIETFGKGGYFREVVSLFDAMIDGTVDPNMQTYMGLLHACGMAGLHQEAGKVYQHLLSRELKPDSDIFSGLIRSYGNAALYQEADIAFRSSIEVECTVNETAFEALIHVYAKGGLYKEAAATLANMQQAGCPVTRDTYKSLIEAFGKSGLLQSAKKACSDLQEAGYPLDLEIHETLLNVYCISGLFDEAKAEFLEMKELTPVPQVTSYCLMLSISARRSRWDDVRRLLDEMQGSTMPDLHVFVAGLIQGNFDETSNWSGIVQPAFDGMKIDGIESNMIFFNALLDVLWWSSQRSRAARVLGEVRLRGVFPELSRRTSNVWSVDVHRMSLGAALTAVVSWFEELQVLAKLEEDLPKLFSIITRRLKEKQVEEAEAPVSKLLFTTVEGMGAPFKFAPWNEGRLISFTDLLIPWLRNNSVSEEFLADGPLPAGASASLSSVRSGSTIHDSNAKRNKQLTAL